MIITIIIPIFKHYRTRFLSVHQTPQNPLFSKRFQAFPLILTTFTKHRSKVLFLIVFIAKSHFTPFQCRNSKRTYLIKPFSDHYIQLNYFIIPAKPLVIQAFLLPCIVFLSRTNVRLPKTPKNLLISNIW